MLFEKAVILPYYLGMTDQLINEPGMGTVIAHDLYGNLKEIPTKDLKLRVSVYGVLKEGNKFLVQRHPVFKKYGLPGGAIELGEQIEQALVREFKEETGLEIKVKKLLDVKIDFFFYEDTKVHSIFDFS